MTDNLTTEKEVISYKVIADRLRTKYRVENCLRITLDGEKEIGVRVHINPIMKHTALFYIESLLSGWGLKIYYANNEEYIYVKIP